MKTWAAWTAGLAIGLGLALGGAATAWAAAGPDDLELPLEGVVTNPDWRTRPSGEEMEREYPPLAQMMQMPGGATIRCTAEPDGRLDDCHVVSEWPEGLGFGAASVRLTAYFSMKPGTIDGRPVAGKVMIPIRFQLDGGAAPPAAATPPAVPAPALELARRIEASQQTSMRLHASWSGTVDQMAARGVVEGDPLKAQQAVDAFRQGLDDAIASELDARAHWVASRMSLAELKATADFLASPAGAAWTAAGVATDAAMPKDFNQRIARAARAHLCQKIDCGPSPATSAPTSGN